MKRQDQSPALQKLDVVEHVYNPSAPKTEAGEAGIQGQPQLCILSSKLQGTLCPKKNSIIMKNELMNCILKIHRGALLGREVLGLLFFVGELPLTPYPYPKFTVLYVV